MKILIITTLLILSSFSQPCLDPNGNPVSWWVQLLFPGSVPGGFAYIDSSATSPDFVIHQEAPDSENTPLTRTLTQINEMNLQSFAWNDETPAGKVSSSKAHSKTVIAYNYESFIGFMIDHSIPQYPAFNGFKVNPEIDVGQQKYGQHAFCLSVDDSVVGNLVTKVLPIKPYIYATNLNNPDSIQNLMNSGTIQSPNYEDLFTYQNYTINNTDMRFIFKNGKINGSIFEDGINNMLNSSLVAETWGRPLQEPWCGKNSVGNIRYLTFNSEVSWKETQDHSKWCYALENNFACFGDMNRMTSQWKRGGAFYCLNSAILKNALTKITSQTQTC